LAIEIIQIFWGLIILSHMFQPRITPFLQMILAIAQFQRKVHTYAAICIEKLLRVKDKTPQAAACGWSSPHFHRGDHPLQGITSDGEMSVNPYTMF
jgi:hypothetical protein